VGVTSSDGDLALNVDDVVSDNHNLAALILHLLFNICPRPGGGNLDALFEFLQLLFRRLELTHGLVVGDGGDVAFNHGVGNTNKVLGMAEHFETADEPLGWVVVIPLDPVSVILGEFMVEVVVAFTKSEDRAQPRVVGGVVLGKVLDSAEEGRVGERVDKEGGLVDKEGLCEGSVEVATDPVAADETADDSGKDNAGS